MREFPSVSIKQAIAEQARILGFDAIGVTAAALAEADRDNLQRFVDQGRHGDMGWMAETRERRGDPGTLWPEARTVICLAMNYGPETDPLAALDSPDKGGISVYAQGRDYHDVVKKRLKALARWMVAEYGCQVKVFVDTAPVMEKPLARNAGLGWIGKHTNLVSRRFGSWLFLGEVFTDLALDPDPPATDRCGSCTRCIDACPTGALDVPYRIDARRCISYLTIESRAEIPVSLADKLGNRIYGCDDCLAVCPWNKFARPLTEPALMPTQAGRPERLDTLAQLDDAGFRQRFSGSPVKRIGIQRFLRNVAVALRNATRAGAK